MDRRPVEMVRVEREEEYFEREAVLGRDTSSVFPTESKKANALDPEALKAAIGGDRKFISATELEEIKAKRGLAVEDGTLAPSKPLAEVLREAKEKKEQDFQDLWKQMKQGKNRPLDEDELEFLDGVANAAVEQERAVRQQEEAELAAFHEALRQQQEARDAELAAKPPHAGGAAHKQQHGSQQHKRLPAKPKAKPLVVIKRSSRSSDPAEASGDGRQPGQAQGGSSDDRVPGASSGGPEEPLPSKRQRVDGGVPGVQEGAVQAGQGQQQAGGSEGLREEDIGLPGLLGGYGSGSEGSDT